MTSGIDRLTDRIVSDKCKRLARLWNSWRGQDIAPVRENGIDLEELKDLGSSTILLDVINREEAIYQHYGRFDPDFLNRDMTGRRNFLDRVSGVDLVNRKKRLEIVCSTPCGSLAYFPAEVDGKPDSLIEYLSLPVLKGEPGYPAQLVIVSQAIRSRKLTGKLPLKGSGASPHLFHLIDIGAGLPSGKGQHMGEEPLQHIKRSTRTRQS